MLRYPYLKILHDLVAKQYFFLWSIYSFFSPNVNKSVHPRVLRWFISAGFIQEGSVSCSRRFRQSNAHNVWHSLHHAHTYLYIIYIYIHDTLSKTHLDTDNIQGTTTDVLLFLKPRNHFKRILAQHTVQFSQNAPAVEQTTLSNSHRTFDAWNVLSFEGRDRPVRKCVHIQWM